MFMQCPFCGTEMVRGELRNNGGNYFLPEGHKAPLLYTENSMKKVGAFMVPPNQHGIFRNNYISLAAYWCKTCNRILIECDQ